MLCMLFSEKGCRSDYQRCLHLSFIILRSFGYNRGESVESRGGFFCFEDLGWGFFVFCFLKFF